MCANWHQRSVCAAPVSPVGTTTALQANARTSCSADAVVTPTTSTPVSSAWAAVPIRLFALRCCLTETWNRAAATLPATVKLAPDFRKPLARSMRARAPLSSLTAPERKSPAFNRNSAVPKSNGRRNWRPRQQLPRRPRQVLLLQRRKRQRRRQRQRQRHRCPHRRAASRCPWSTTRAVRKCVKSIWDRVTNSLLNATASAASSPFSAFQPNHRQNVVGLVGASMKPESVWQTPLHSSAAKKPAVSCVFIILLL